MCLQRWRRLPGSPLRCQWRMTRTPTATTANAARARARFACWRAPQFNAVTLWGAGRVLCVCVCAHCVLVPPSQACGASQPVAYFRARTPLASYISGGQLRATLRTRLRVRTRTCEPACTCVCVLRENGHASGHASGHVSGHARVDARSRWCIIICFYSYLRCCAHSRFFCPLLGMEQLCPRRCVCSIALSNVLARLV